MTPHRAREAEIGEILARVGVAVKPLEWEHVAGEIFDAATPIGGAYRVRQQDGEWVVALSGGVLGWFDTKPGAMTFANGHFKARILSALSTGAHQ